MKDDKDLYWIWLSERCGSESREFGRLVAEHDDPYELYSMSNEEIEHIAGIKKKLKEKLCNKALEDAYSILKKCQKEDIDIIPYTDERYPARLRNIQDPPVLLYCKGKLPDINSRLCMGVVGTRKMSEYGMSTAYSISYELASAGAVIVSGMALGIDAVSACGALEASGDTVAVLGSGISVVYPAAHKELMRTIAKRGAVISEYPPMESPHGYNFPRRNRIISGLCQGTLIIEGDLNSGAMITARKAISQGREVFALPGNVSESNSEGPNRLIREGANVVLSSNDVLNYYDFLYRDVVDKNAHAQAKLHSRVSERTLKRYGVTWAGYKDKYEVVSTVVLEDDNAIFGEKKTKSKEASFKKEKSLNRAETSMPEKDRSAEVLASVDDATRKVFECMPIGDAVTPDVIAERGFGVGDVITALTVLELAGLVSSLPGGAYIRK